MKKETDPVKKDDLFSSFLDSVLDDYHNCSDKDDCSHCSANMAMISASVSKVDGYTYCEFLRRHRIHTENILIAAMDKAL